MPVNNTPLVWDHASLSCCRTRWLCCLCSQVTLGLRRRALRDPRKHRRFPPHSSGIKFQSRSRKGQELYHCTAQLSEKSPSPLSLPPRLPLGFPYCLLVCLTALISLNLRTAWQEDWRTAKQKRYSNGSHVKLAPFVVVLADFSRELIICLHNLHTWMNFGCFSNSRSLCLTRYHFFWHLVMNASPTHAEGMWRTTEYPLACWCDIFTS